jgi:hypothetical protein
MLLTPKMDCADKHGGRIQALPGLHTWGYRTRTRATRYLKHAPCWLDKKSNMLNKAPQYE